MVFQSLPGSYLQDRPDAFLCGLSEYSMVYYTVY
jgi:hypothetical protein